MSYTVYCHTGPTGRRYVGVTSQPVLVRWDKGRRYKSCRLLNDDIIKYGWDSFEHTIIASGLTESEAYQMENELISDWNLMDAERGYHLREGGKTGKFCEETKRLMSEKNLGNKHAVGQYHSPENRKQISESLKAYYKTHDNPMLGVKRPEISGHNHPRARSVVQIDLTGKCIAVFLSMKEASDSSGVRTQKIWNCCTGRAKTAGGYRWEYTPTE